MVVMVTRGPMTCANGSVEKKIYLVVGAYAVAFYGYPRYAADLDLLLNPTAENAARVLQVLKDFGIESLKVTSTDLQTPNRPLN